MRPIYSRYSLIATASPDIYPLSLHDALPISESASARGRGSEAERGLGVDQAGVDVAALGIDDRGVRRHGDVRADRLDQADRKSTRLNSSHTVISYAVFCLKKKRNNVN